MAWAWPGLTWPGTTQLHCTNHLRAQRRPGLHFGENHHGSDPQSRLISVAASSSNIAALSQPSLLSLALPKRSPVRYQRSAAGLCLSEPHVAIPLDTTGLSETPMRQFFPSMCFGRDIFCLGSAWLLQGTSPAVSQNDAVSVSPPTTAHAAVSSSSTSYRPTRHVITLEALR